MSTYLDFLATKMPKLQLVGFEPTTKVNGNLFSWQAHLVRWALKLGRAAIFADCGLGKTLMQLEWAHHVAHQEKRPVLILCPLAVAAQTVREAKRFGVKGVKYCAEQADVGSARIVVTNYERLDRFDPKAFAGVVLDESSVLKSFMGKTKRALVDAFEHTRFKLACTATPSPNDVMELGNHCEFLGVMTSHEMLARFFINDSMNMGTYRIKGHAETDFWRWVVSWAACVASPADLFAPDGKPYAADGYVLPQLQLIEHAVEGPSPEPLEGELVAVVNLNATTMHAEMRRTTEARAAQAAELVLGEPDEQWLIWCNTNYEADELRRVLPDAVEVRGNDTTKVKEQAALDFADGKIRVLISKGTIFGLGLNFQNCARMAFVGLNYSFEQFYQSLRRSYRFGQKREVHAHIICAKTEMGVRASIARKQEEHRRLQQRMVQMQREAQGQSTTIELGASGILETARGDGWEIHLGDCVDVLPAIPDATVGLTIFSPPFSNLYCYSASPRDMGNTADDDEYFRSFGFLVPEMLRATIPGRLCAVHTKDLPQYKSSAGASGLRDFTGETIRAMEAHVAADGSRWVYHSKVTIWKCPVTEMQRTKSHGLLYKTLRADASYSRQGCPDYVTTFRKWTPGIDSADPVRHTEDELPLEMWQRYASPVWDDIDQQDVLNVVVARAAQDERHMCPLQLGLVERVVHLWSNPGDLVLSPFAGIGSEGVPALKARRRFVGVELKSDYFKWASRNLAAATAQGDLFETLEAANG